MAVHFITGKLGSGKSLVAVGKIRDYLRRGAKVATNLDIRLNKMFGDDAKKACLYRLPDKPTIQDLETIGLGNTTYDESKNGLLVLDECGTWFNSRTWADKERQLVINWFLHARKKGWDIIFIIQNIAVVDKQAKLTLAEHVVYCRRLDKMSIPFVGTIWKIFTGEPLRLPKLHVASVRYGDLPTSLIVDRWWYFGLDLYDCYDTKQAFSDYYEHNTYQVLPPWYSHGRYRLPLTWNRFMRLTKIYGKRFRGPVTAGAMFCAGIAAAIWFRDPVIIESASADPAVEVAQAEEGADTSTTAADTKTAAEPDKPVRPVHDKYTSWRLDGHIKIGDKVAYLLRSPAGEVVTMDNVRRQGVDVFPVDNCQLKLVSTTDLNDWVSVYANVCSPDSLGRAEVATAPPAKPFADPQARYVPPPMPRSNDQADRSTGTRYTQVSSGKPGLLW